MSLRFATLFVFISLFGLVEAADLRWTQLPPLPDDHGFAGPFAGASGGALIVAGGANFPDKPLWETDKVWHDTIWVFEKESGKWQRAEQKLPRRAAYGISLTVPGSGKLAGVLCIGGGDSKNHFRSVFLLRWQDRTIRRKPFPDLPEPMAFACGAIVGRTVVVAGGTKSPTAFTASAKAFALSLDDVDAGWKRLPDYPGRPRMLSTAGAAGNRFFLIAGTAIYNKDGKVARQYLGDAYALDLKSRKWEKIAAPPILSVAAPTPAPLIQGKLLLLGGDNGKLADKVDSLRDQHPGFPQRVVAFDPVQGTWSDFGTLPKKMVGDPATDPHKSWWPPVTTATVPWGDSFLLPAGEVRPRVRSRRVFVGTLK